MKKLLKEKGSSLVEKLIIVAFSLAAGTAVIGVLVANLGEADDAPTVTIP
jgi:hypothetical protein